MTQKDEMLKLADRFAKVVHHGREPGLLLPASDTERDLIVRAVNGLPEAIAALEELCDEIEADEEHGSGADEDDCPICIAIRKARAALTKLKG